MTQKSCQSTTTNSLFMTMQNYVHTRGRGGGAKRRCSNMKAVTIESLLFCGLFIFKSYKRKKSNLKIHSPRFNVVVISSIVKINHKRPIGLRKTSWSWGQSCSSSFNVSSNASTFAHLWKTFAELKFASQKTKLIHVLRIIQCLSQAD